MRSGDRGLGIFGQKLVAQGSSGSAQIIVPTGEEHFIWFAQFAQGRQVQSVVCAKAHLPGQVACLPQQPKIHGNHEEIIPDALKFSGQPIACGRLNPANPDGGGER
jgi:hypothetical protein